MLVFIGLSTGDNGNCISPWNEKYRGIWGHIRREDVKRRLGLMKGEHARWDSEGLVVYDRDPDLMYEDEKIKANKIILETFTLSFVWMHEGLVPAHISCRGSNILDFTNVTNQAQNPAHIDLSDS